MVAHPEHPGTMKLLAESHTLLQVPVSILKAIRATGDAILNVLQGASWPITLDMSPIYLDFSDSTNLLRGPR